jgi:integrase
MPSLASTAPNPDHAKTFGEVAKEFLDARTAQYSADQLGRYRSMLELHVPAPLYARPMAAIDAQEIADMLRPIWNGSVDSTGRKLRPLIEMIFNAARITPNPATLASLTSGLVNGLPKSSTARAKSVASLPYAEVPTLMKELSNDSGDLARLIRFIILTGVRIKEALGAHWSEIDLKARTWTIPTERMKMDVEHVVPLSNAALKLLGPKGEGLIFRGTRFGREIGQNVALRFLKTFGRVDDKGASITIHGFRSSMATWAEERKPPFLTKVIHFNLAHYSKQDKVSKADLRGAHWTERCEMMAAWGEFVTTRA